MTDRCCLIRGGLQPIGDAGYSGGAPDILPVDMCSSQYGEGVGREYNA
jgi:hypothetical protein